MPASHISRRIQAGDSHFCSDCETTGYWERCGTGTLFVWRVTCPGCGHVVSVTDWRDTSPLGAGDVQPISETTGFDESGNTRC